jgi:hypothetical protein
MVTSKTMFQVEQAFLGHIRCLYENFSECLSML